MMPDESLPPELGAVLADQPSGARERLAETWRTIGAAAPPAGAAPSTAEAWAEIERHMARAPSGRRDRAPARRNFRLAAPAGLALGLLAVSVVALVVLQQPVIVEAPAGEVLAHVLPDGSEALLASDTRLAYRRGLRSRPAGARSVDLSGEAFFSVVPGERPFIVKTYNAEVAVLGTSFNVRARPDDLVGVTRVAVESGRVRVRCAACDIGGIVLQAGEAADASEAEVRAVEVSADQRVAVWREGGLSIQNLPLADVLREVERRFRITIRAADGVPLDRQLTLYYVHAADPETVIHDIALAMDLQYRPLRGGFDLFQSRSR
jgi:transmembrane sensor